MNNLKINKNPPISKMMEKSKIYGVIYINSLFSKNILMIFYINKINDINFIDNNI